MLLLLLRSGLELEKRLVTSQSSQLLQWNFTCDLWDAHEFAVELEVLTDDKDAKLSRHRDLGLPRNLSHEEDEGV